MLLPLRRYADFQGRSRRMEYWMFTLLIILASIVWGIVFAILGGFSGFSEYGGSSLFSGIAGLWAVVGGLAYLAILIPGIAVQVRRFHDRDMSGWFVLLNFIPYVGGLIVIVFMLLEGTRGPNRFGPDPKDPLANAEALARDFS
ncbi:DUF805 domain-containing protein [Sphingomonas sp. dw_22]|uniref:DUF805 domain-containing protein n=1 Tax=Sphingomonas sp. dw_22 TaxID=2721175 RepID=UPI0031FE6D01